MTAAVAPDVKNAAAGTENRAAAVADDCRGTAAGLTLLSINYLHVSP